MKTCARTYPSKVDLSSVRDKLQTEEDVDELQREDTGLQREQVESKAMNNRMQSTDIESQPQDEDSQPGVAVLQSYQDHLYFDEEDELSENDHDDWRLTVSNNSRRAKITDYDLAIRGMSLVSEDRPLAMAYICSQLRDETKLLPILRCPVIAFAKNAARFLRYRDRAMIHHVTKVVMFQKKRFLDESERVPLSEIKDILERRDTMEGIQINMRLPDNSPWE